MAYPKTLTMADLAVLRGSGIPSLVQQDVLLPARQGDVAGGNSSERATPEVTEAVGELDALSDVSTDAMIVMNAPAPPRVFFTDMTFCPCYGYGFLLRDLRLSVSCARTEAIGAVLNDGSKIIRDVLDDTVWYFARVGEENNGGRVAEPAAVLESDRALLEDTPDTASPKRFYKDQLHQFSGGARLLNPKSSACEALSPFLQTQNVFKKYSITTFFESVMSPAPVRDSERQKVSRRVTSALSLFSLKHQQEVFSPRATLNTPQVGNAASQITYVKEAWITPITGILPPSHALQVELPNTVADGIPLMAAARFSDHSFQVSLSGPCPSSPQLMPQVVGARDTPALRSWKLDMILYDTNKMTIVHRADDDLHALSMANVGLQKHRGTGNTIFYSATASFPRHVKGILIPDTTLELIAAMLRKVQCQDALLAAIVME